MHSWWFILKLNELKQKSWQNSIKISLVYTWKMKEKTSHFRLIWNWVKVLIWEKIWKLLYTVQSTVAIWHSFRWSHLQENLFPTESETTALKRIELLALNCVNFYFLFFFFTFFKFRIQHAGHTFSVTHSS